MIIAAFFVTFFFFLLFLSNEVFEDEKNLAFLAFEVAAVVVVPS